MEKFFAMGDAPALFLDQNPKHRIDRSKIELKWTPRLWVMIVEMTKPQISLTTTNAVFLFWHALGLSDSWWWFWFANGDWFQDARTCLKNVMHWSYETFAHLWKFASGLWLSRGSKWVRPPCLIREHVHFGTSSQLRCLDTATTKASNRLNECKHIHVYMFTTPD